MSRIKSVDLGNLSTEQQQVHDDIVNGPRGRFLDPFTGLLLSPEIGSLAQQWGAYLRFKSKLPGKLRELAVLITVRHWKTHFEWHYHGKMALTEGLAQHIMDSLVARTRPNFEEEAEETVYDFVTELLSSGSTTDTTYERAVDQFGEECVFELTSMVGYYCFFSFNVNGFKYELPEEVVPLPD